MAIPKWISDLAGKTASVATKGYKVANGPTINFDDPTYAELYDKYITGKLEEAEASAVDEIEYLRDVANQATAKLISAMQNKLAADDKKKEPAAKEPAAAETPKLETPDKNENAAPATKEKVVHKDDRLPEPGSSKWREVRYNERLDAWQGISTERKVQNFRTEDEAIDGIRDM